ncbi:MAG: hypothetical protein JWO59_1178 [Chloroflexi bacterium]|nr:hypothetical protein [Chloroflexota bacterium]
MEPYGAGGPDAVVCDETRGRAGAYALCGRLAIILIFPAPLLLVLSFITDAYQNGAPYYPPEQQLFQHLCEGALVVELMNGRCPDGASETRSPIMPRY